MNEVSRSRIATGRAIACLVLVLSFWLSPSAPAADVPRLNILLTNDDGFDSHGLAVLSAALRAAGHRVTVVAPADQQSGTGAHVSLTPFAVEHRGEAAWTVAGTPADAVLVGVQGVLASSPPDLVVAGPNYGQNLGANVINSGTVGAAMMAVQEGIPAIALSVGIDLEERHARPRQYPSTVAAFARAAALGVRLIERLVERRGESGTLLPAGLLLNVNYPVVGAREKETPRIAPVGRFGGFRLRYPPMSGSAEVRTAFAYDDRGRAEAGSDTAFFAAGYTTVSVIEPPWPVDSAHTRALERWLAAVLARP